jgi:fatty-acyl-CoA synthase
VTEVGTSLDPLSLEAYGRQRLARFQVPRHWISVDELPLTASGKVRKVELEGRVHRLLEAEG